MRIMSTLLALTSVLIGAFAHPARAAEAERFSYRAPACKGAKSSAQLKRYLQTQDFTPEINEAPYTMLAGIVSLPQAQLIEARKSIGSLETLRERIFANVWDGDKAFSSRTDDDYPRQNQVQWFDLDGDGECDLLGWSFADEGWGARGRFQPTFYFVFLQKKGRLKLIDWSTDPCDTEVAYTCNGQRPDAIVPVWRTGEALPYLVGRSDLTGFVSGIYFSVIGSKQIPDERSVFRWNPKQLGWERPTKSLSDEINRFVSLTPPQGKSQCISLQPDDYGAECHLPR